MKEYYKDFDSWAREKKRVQEHGVHHRLRDVEFLADTDVYFRVGEVRWVQFGVNIGSEMDGKGSAFSRPALILRVFRKMVFVVPLSTKEKGGSFGYIPFEFGDSKSAALFQARMVSRGRVGSRLLKIPSAKLAEVRRDFRELFEI